MCVHSGRTDWWLLPCSYSTPRLRPRVKGYDLVMWSISAMASLTPARADVARETFWPTGGCARCLFVDSFHPCRHPSSLSGRGGEECVCLIVRLCVCVSGWLRHCGCWLICCVPIFTCSEKNKRRKGCMCGRDVCMSSWTWVHTTATLSLERQWVHILGI